MTTLFVNHLTVIDCSYLHPERGLIGESWIVDIELTGSLDEQGMIFDFSAVKEQIKTTIDHCIDHKLLVSNKLPNLSINEINQQQIQITWDNPDYYFFMQAPKSALVLLEDHSYSYATLESLIRQAVETILPKNVKKFTLKLRTEHIESAYYHYSHGLKKHQGHCQRIAHGHRSRLEIYKNGQRDQSLENYWADQLRDSYIGQVEDIQKEIERYNKPYYQFSYQALDGEFILELPQSQCHLIRHESTVENIAQHIINLLKKQEPNSQFRVKAFEGVNKGAIANN